MENQNNYSSKFSEILENMDVFTSNNEKIAKRKTKKMNKDNKSENNDDSQSDGEEEDRQDENQNSTDAGFDLSDQQMDEQLEDSDSLKESTENVLQKKDIKNIDHEYKVFTTEFDEVARSESL